MNELSDTQPVQHLLRVADLPTRKPTHFDLRPSEPELDALAKALGISEVRKLRLSGRLSPQGKTDWRLEAMLGATVVQPCILTLSPVVTRIDEPVARVFMSKLPDFDADSVEEMPEDDSIEQLGSHIDIGAVLQEALALALPLYPKAADAKLEETTFTEPGKQAMSDEEARPFAGLSALRDKLQKDS